MAWPGIFWKIIILNLMETPIDREGTAIGTKFASAFANIFISKLERKMLSECILKPWFWWRFLDDVLFIWLHRVYFWSI